MDEDVLAPNTRVSQIKRFLAKPPQSAHRLVLMAASGSTDVQLGEWNRHDVLPGIALEVAAAMQEHADALSAHVTGVLSYRNESNELVGGSKVLQWRPDQAERVSESLASSPSELTGDARSQSIQAQKHLEAIQRMTLSAMSSLFMMMRQNTEHTMELCEALATRLAESEVRERRSKQHAEEVEEVLSSIEAAGGDPVTESQDKIMKLAETMLPILLQKMGGGGGGGT